jgi:hypothetical protein
MASAVPLGAGRKEDDERRRRGDRRPDEPDEEIERESIPAAKPTVARINMNTLRTVKPEHLLHAVVTERVDQMRMEADRASAGFIGLVLQTVVDEMRTFLPKADSRWAQPGLRDELKRGLRNLHQKCYLLALEAIDHINGARETVPPLSLNGAFGEFSPPTNIQGFLLNEVVDELTNLVFHALQFDDTKLENGEYARLFRHVVLGQMNEAIVDWAWADDAVVRELLLKRHPDYDWRNVREDDDDEKVASPPMTPPSAQEVEREYAAFKAKAEAEWNRLYGPGAPFPAPLPMTVDTMAARLDHGSPLLSSLFATKDELDTVIVINAPPNKALTPQRNRNLRRLMTDIERTTVVLPALGAGSSDSMLAMSSFLLGVDGIRPTMLTTVAAGDLSWISGYAGDVGQAPPPPPPTINDDDKTFDARDALVIRETANSYRNKEWATAGQPPSKPTPTTDMARDALGFRARQWLTKSPILHDTLSQMAEEAGVKADHQTLLTNFMVLAGMGGPIHELEAVAGMEAAPAVPVAPEPPQPSRWQRIISWYNNPFGAFFGGGGAPQPAPPVEDPTIQAAKRADRLFLASTLRLHLFNQLVVVLLDQLCALMVRRGIGQGGKPGLDGDGQYSVERMENERTLFEQQVNLLRERQTALVPAWYARFSAVVENVTQHGGYGPFDARRPMAHTPTLDMPYICRDLVELAALGTVVRGDLWAHWLLRAIGLWRTERAEETQQGTLIDGAMRRVKEALLSTGRVLVSVMGEEPAADPDTATIQDLVELSTLDLLSNSSITATVMESLGSVQVGRPAFLSILDLFGCPPHSLEWSRDFLVSSLNAALSTETIHAIMAQGLPDPFAIPLEAKVPLDRADTDRIAPLVWLLNECASEEGSRLEAAATGFPLLQEWFSLTMGLVAEYRRIDRNLFTSFDYWPIALQSPRTMTRDERTGKVKSVGGKVSLDYLGETWPFCMISDLLIRLPPAVLLNQPTLGWMFWRRRHARPD